VSLNNVLEEGFLDLYFNGTAIPDIAENDTTGPATVLEVTLHTADPGEAGTKLTNEATYTGYTRVTVARTAGGWLRSDSTINPVTTITFPVATSGPETIAFWSVGPPGNDILHWSGAVDPLVEIPAGGGGIQPGIRGIDNAPASTITLD